jgi:hypothetical protein
MPLNVIPVNVIRFRALVELKEIETKIWKPLNVIAVNVIRFRALIELKTNRNKIVVFEVYCDHRYCYQLLIVITYYRSF